MVFDAIVGFGVGSVPPLQEPAPLVTAASLPGPVVARAGGVWRIEYRGRRWTVSGGTAEATVRGLAEQLKREADAPPGGATGICPGGVCPVPGK